MNTAYIKTIPKTNKYKDIGFDKGKTYIHILIDGRWALTNTNRSYEFSYKDLKDLESEWEWIEMWRENGLTVAQVDYGDF